MPNAQFTNGQQSFHPQPHLQKMKTSIFISIACMDDEEIYSTVSSAMDNCSGDHDIFIGIGLLYINRSTLSIVKKIKRKYKGVRVSSIKLKDPGQLGVGKGRKRAQDLYNSEDYFLQVDSHTFFDNNWDRVLVDTFKESVSIVGDDKLVITAIPGSYINDPIVEPEYALRWTRYPGYLQNQKFYNSVPKWNDFQIIRDGFNTSPLIPAVKANAALMFGNKVFASNTGLDEDVVFFDEEVIYSINLVGNGFAMVFPNYEYFPIYHLDYHNCSLGHTRMALADYISLDSIAQDASKKYLSFISDPKNQSLCKKYSEYAKIDLTRGYFGNATPYIPEKFRI